MVALRRRFLALGDSYTVGESVAPEEAWPAQLTSRIPGPPFDVHVVAVTGWTSGELLSALEKSPPEGLFDLVSVQVGVNDQYRSLPIDQFVANAVQLLVRADHYRGEAGGVFAVSIPDWGVTPFGADRNADAIGAEIDSFNAAWREVAGEVGIPFADVTPLSRSHPELVAEDGLHPSGRQYRLWVEAILPVVRPMLADSTE
ncbi:MAG: SGNH/GDSL hydrolase family protein [Acidimicrobiia bacterium]